MLRCSQLAAWTSALLLMCAGCGDDRRPRPIASGRLHNVTIWARPVQRPGELGENSGNTYINGRVDVYDNFILVTPEKHDSIVALHGWYTDLRFKKD